MTMQPPNQPRMTPNDLAAMAESIAPQLTPLQLLHCYNYLVDLYNAKIDRIKQLETELASLKGAK